MERKKAGRCNYDKLRQMKTGLFRFIAEGKYGEGANRLLHMLQIMSARSNESRLAGTKMRNYLYRLLHSIKISDAEEDVAASNFVNIIWYLSNKFSRKRVKKPLKIYSFATYCAQLIPAFRFASDRGKRFEQLNKNDLQEFIGLHKSSSRIIRDLLKRKSELPGAVDIDLDDPSLRAPKIRDVFEFMYLNFESLDLARLSKDEALVLILAGELLARVGEIARLKKEHIVLNSPVPGISFTGKGSKERFVPLSYFEYASRFLKNIFHSIPNGYVICKPNGKPYSIGGINKIAKRALLRLGLPPKHIHYLRHISVNRLLLKGVTLKIVSELAGHAHVATTIHEYAHVQGLLALKRASAVQVLLNKVFDYQPSFLDTKDAAGLLGTSIRNIQYLAKSGKVKAAKLSGEWNFPEAELLSHKLSRGRACCL